MFTVMHGSPFWGPNGVGGMKASGLFDDFESAIEYGNANYEVNWFVVEIEPAQAIANISDQTPDNLITLGAGLMSPDGSNPEYDRAIIELVSDFLGYSVEEYDDVVEMLQDRQRREP